MPTPPNPRKKKVLAPSIKYQIYRRLDNGDKIMDLAREFGVDRQTIIRARDVAVAGAMEALSSSKPGRQQRTDRDIELEETQRENTRLKEALAEMGVRLMLAEGKELWD